ncbi:MAG TPA: ATP-binding protein [Candidatus Limnocylindria bacterium]|nr:ATP-binding protein [Candidatus Limnocylindria bacterium]
MALAMRLNRDHPARNDLSALVVIGGTAVLLFPFRAQLDTLSVALIFLIVVTAVALYGNTWSGVLASLTAFLCFDLLFIPPYFRPNVAHLDDVLVLFVFLGIAVLTSQLVVRVRQKTAEALRRGHETTSLYDLSIALIGESSLPETLTTIARHMERSFALDSCIVLLDEGVSPSGSGDGAPRADVPGDHQSTLSAGSAPGRLAIPVGTARRALGVLLVSRRPPRTAFDEGELQLLETFANQAAIAIERIILTEEETRAEVLAQSDALKSALLSAVSHDLRTPLASIKASATSLLQPGIAWGEVDRRELLQAIDEEADRLNRLVANLLDLSRIEAGVLRPAFDWCEPGEVIYEALNRCELSLSGHRLALRIPDDLPPLRLDFIEIVQVIVNLLENAAKFSPTGSTISIAAEVLDGSLRVSVRDEGIGIPKGEEARVFDKFYRVERRQRSSGSGLGLAICRGFVEVHGGHIWAEPALSRGTIIRFTLPIPPGVPAPAPAAPGRRQA